MSEVEDLIRVCAVPGLGRSRYRRLVERFGSWSRVTQAGMGELTAVEGITASMAGAIRRSPEMDVSGELEEARSLGVHVVPYTHPEYPANLAPMEDAPLMLYVKGSITETDRMAMAVVGSRNCTYYGRSQAEKLANQLARAGFCIVSGLARGVDVAAHRAALDAGGRTIAVVGSGLKRLYPEEHRQVADAIARSGAVVSELPLDSPPRAENFPPRNRIIAGLSMGVVVVEARRHSGALITARWAVESGKEVFAVPGQIDNPRSRGCHSLIKDGAKLVESARDILEELGPLAESIQLPGEEAGKPPPPHLSEVDKRLLDALSHQPRTVDEIVSCAGLEVSRVLSGLLSLEVGGLVRQLPGQRFVRLNR